MLYYVKQKNTELISVFWLHLVEDVGTKIRNSKEWVYMPVLNLGK